MIALSFNDKCMSFNDKLMSYDAEPQITYKRYMWRFDDFNDSIFQMGAIKVNNIDLPYTYVAHGKGGGYDIAAQMPQQMVAAIVGQDENRKWCSNGWYSNKWGWLIFDLPNSVVPYKYELQIAGDTAQYPGRNPKRVRLYASTGMPTTFEDDSWVLLSDYNQTLPTTNYAWATIWEI